MRLAIASGKGGTGKTTVAVNLAWLLKDAFERVVLIDCDVEEPNCHLFLGSAWESEETRFMPVPAIDETKCLGESCRKCVELCRFKCMIMLGGAVMVFPEMCHGCGLCKLACPTGAVVDSSRELGTIRSAAIGRITLHGGLLRVGEAMASPLIRQLKDHVAPEPAAGSAIQILDCPPGAACPTITALDGADYALLVAEPTAFGLHDLTIAVTLLRRLEIPFGAVINRAGMGDDRVAAFLAREGVPLLASIPYSRQAAEACSEGRLLADALPDVRQALQETWSNILQRTDRRETAGDAA